MRHKRPTNNPGNTTTFNMEGVEAIRKERSLASQEGYEVYISNVADRFTGNPHPYRLTANGAPVEVELDEDGVILSWYRPVNKRTRWRHKQYDTRLGKMVLIEDDRPEKVMDNTNNSNDVKQSLAAIAKALLDVADKL